MQKGPMKQPRGLAIILGTLALGAGIYHGISPVSSHNMSCRMSLEILKFSQQQEATDRPLYVRTSST